MDEQQRQVAQCIDEEMKIAVAAVKEISRYVGDDDSPLTYTQVLLFQGRCETIVDELQKMAEATRLAAQNPT